MMTDLIDCVPATTFYSPYPGHMVISAKRLIAAVPWAGLHGSKVAVKCSCGAELIEQDSSGCTDDTRTLAFAMCIWQKHVGEVTGMVGSGIVSFADELRSVFCFADRGVALTVHSERAREIVEQYDEARKFKP